MAFIYYTTVLLIVVVYSASSFRIRRDIIADLSKQPYVQSVLNVLPPNTKAEVMKIIGDTNMTPQQKLEKFHSIFSALPEDVKNKIPMPPALKKLPQPIQDKILGIVKGSSSLAQKRAQLDAVYNSLTPEQKQMVPLWGKLREQLGGSYLIQL